MGAVLGHKVPVGRVGVVEFLQLVLHPDEGRLELVHTDVKLVGSVDVNHQHVNPAAKITGLAQFFKHQMICAPLQKGHFSALAHSLTGALFAHTKETVILRRRRDFLVCLLLLLSSTYFSSFSSDTTVFMFAHHNRSALLLSFPANKSKVIWNEYLR